MIKEIEENEAFDSFEETLKIASILNSCHVDWAFVGGIAVAVHGYIRATEDIDVIVKASDLHLIDEALEKAGFIINASPIEFNDGFVLHKRVFIKGSAYFVLDLLVPTDSFNVFESCLESEFREEKVRVISKEDLLKMKKSAGRAKDLLDIEELTKGE